MEHANFWLEAIPFQDCMKVFGDSHPLIQRFLKTVLPKSSNQPSTTNYMGKKFTTPEFFNLYSMAWFVTGETQVQLYDGTILQGED